MNEMRDAWRRLESDNQAERLAFLGTSPCATSQQTTDMTWVVTGVPAHDYNGIVGTNLTATDADVQVPLLVQQFRDQGLPALWHVDATSGPADLASRLEAQGCARAAAEPVMAAPLSALAREMSRFPGLTVDRVMTPRELREWMDIRVEIAPEPRSVREELYLSLGLGGRQALHHYLARVDGQPAGIAQLFLGRRAAGLYSLGVAPAFRGRGLGTALVLTPLLVARTLGYDVGVVRPPSESAAMYQHLGFTPLSPSSLGYAIGG